MLTVTGKNHTNNAEKPFLLTLKKVLLINSFFYHIKALKIESIRSKTKVILLRIFKILKFFKSFKLKRSPGFY